MHVAVKPPLATAVALVGAGAIALTPVYPSLPEVAVPTVSSAAVHLVAQPNPIALWSEVIAGAIHNAGGIGQEVLSDPVPVLRQILTNQLGNLNIVGSAGKGVIEGLAEYFAPDNPFGLRAGIQDAVEQIKAGQIAAGFATLTSTVIAGPLVVGVGLPLLMSGLLQVPVKIAQNVTDAVGALFDNANIVPLLTAAMGPIVAPINAFGASLQDFVEALGAGHLGDALTAVINVPARLVGAVLNGYTDASGGFAAGLLTVSNDPFSAGLLQAALVNLPRAMATALGAQSAAPATTRLVDKVASPVIHASTTVTLAVPSTETGPATTDGVPVPHDAPPTTHGAVETPVDRAPNEETAAKKPDETPVEQPAAVDKTDVAESPGTEAGDVDGTHTGGATDGTDSDGADGGSASETTDGASGGASSGTGASERTSSGTGASERTSSGTGASERTSSGTGASEGAASGTGASHESSRTDKSSGE
ncbi:hypothetical protein Mycch_3455 [Mycolicibacterium chubuense NBB4]|uniref:PE-PGRS family protein n=1 Tax=Mycolicibacterium chubuense (strain NBB4) TaxID=710421 RepID=I4BLN8_MYCCN|nr:hypothetical protein [Mycolicibacterium chubuense]AFM18195.1 hypothetical protein Mycch_3455 [Mycolicibacterium chubuense NBB4]